MGREIALKALYRIDLLGLGIEEAIKGLSEEERRDSEALDFTRELLESVAAQRTDVDAILQLACDKWELDRVAFIDRAALRLGATEILHWRWIPAEVTINEYVEIAKKFGSEQSGHFVNAVLDRIARERKPVEPTGEAS